LSAGEFYSVVSEKPVALYGIEDIALYKENVESFRELVGRQGQNRRNLRGPRGLRAA